MPQKPAAEHHALHPPFSGFTATSPCLQLLHVLSNLGAFILDGRKGKQCESSFSFEMRGGGRGGKGSQEVCMKVDMT